MCNVIKHTYVANSCAVCRADTCASVTSFVTCLRCCILNSDNCFPVNVTTGRPKIARGWIAIGSYTFRRFLVVALILDRRLPLRWSTLTLAAPSSCCKAVALSSMDHDPNIHQKANDAFSSMECRNLVRKPFTSTNETVQPSGSSSPQSMGIDMLDIMLDTVIKAQNTR